MRMAASSNPRPGQDVADGGGGLVDAVEPGVLGQVAEAAGAVHDPGEGRLGPAQHLQQARLAGPVATDEADLVAGADREAGTLEDDGATHLDSELADLQHPSMLTGRGADGRIRWTASVGSDGCLPLPPTPGHPCSWWRRPCSGARTGRPRRSAPTARAASPSAAPATWSARSCSSRSPRPAVACGTGARDLPRRPLILAAAATAAYQLCFFGGVRLAGVAIGTVVGVGSGPVWGGAARVARPR